MVESDSGKVFCLFNYNVFMHSSVRGTKRGTERGTEMHVQRRRQSGCFVSRKRLRYTVLGIKKNLDLPDVITERETTKGGKESSRPNIPVHHLIARRPLTSLIPALRHNHTP